MTDQREAPLAIDGYTFERSLGSFSLGNSYIYVRTEGEQRVHVLLARQSQSLESFTTDFERVVGDVAEQIILYSGLTDRGRPYLVTDFLDDQDAKAPVSDETVVSHRPERFDETLLSAARTRDDSVSPELSGEPRPPRAQRSVISELVVTERQAVIPSPASLADVTYSPRTLPPSTPHAAVISDSQVTSVAPPASRIARERRRAKISLIAVATGVVCSVLGAVALILAVTGR